MRILCDSLVVIGFLTKSAGTYELTADSAVFLDKKSTAYMGSAAQFLASSVMTDGFKDVTALVRSRQPAFDRPFAEPDHPIWSEFARRMAPLSYLVALETAKLFDSESPIKVLDVGAGHGLFGIALAQRNAKAYIVASDWPSVLTIAQENARRAGVAERYAVLPGDAMELDFGTGFHAVLIPNLLHLWGRTTNERFLRRVYRALGSNGRAVIVELAPNDDRTSPPVPALFALNMLANTAAGDAYTVSEHQDMLRQAGFSNFKAHPLLPTAHTAIVGIKGE
jgi:ubiquinone/menaquinone biosynthesis C-methylase UbiE